MPVSELMLYDHDVTVTEDIDIQNNISTAGRPFEFIPVIVKVLIDNNSGLITDEKDNELHMTVSGVRKKAVSQLKSIEDFNINTVFDIEHAKKNILTYRDDMSRVKWNVGEYDEYISNYKYGISFTPTTYELGMSLDYISLIYNNKREETEIFKNEQAKIL